MKKIIALFVIMLGFGFTASAQQKKAAKTTATAPVSTRISYAEAAKKDLASVDKVATLTAEQKVSVQGLFEYKHREMAAVASSEERKAIISQTIDAKLRATLTAEQMAKLDAKPEVLKKVIQ